MHITTVYVNKLYLSNIKNDHKNNYVTSTEHKQHGRQVNAVIVMSRRCPFGSSAVIGVFKHNQHFREEMKLLAPLCLHIILYVQAHFDCNQISSSARWCNPSMSTLEQLIDKIEIDVLLRKPPGMYA